MNSTIACLQGDIFRGQLWLLAKGKYGEITDPSKACRALVATVSGTPTNAVTPYCILRHLIGTVLSVFGISQAAAYLFRPSVEELILQLPFAPAGVDHDPWYEEQIDQWWSQLRCLCHARSIVPDIQDAEPDLAVKIAMLPYIQSPAVVHAIAA